MEALEQDAASPLATRKRVVPWGDTQLEMEEDEVEPEGRKEGSLRGMGQGGGGRGGTRMSGKRFTKRLEANRVTHRSEAVCAKVAVAAQALFRLTDGSSDLLMDRKIRCGRFHGTPVHDCVPNLH